MITDFEIPVPMPKFDITDPFGFARIKRARWEYKRKAAECESLHYELEQMYADRESALAQLVIANSKLQERLESTEKILRRSDDGRVQMATKASDLSKRVSELEDELAMWKAKCTLLEGDFAELEKEHERVIRAVTDKGEIA